MSILQSYEAYKKRKADERLRNRIQVQTDIANEIYRIEDFGDEIVLTVKGCKAMPITNLEDGIVMLKKLRDDYVNSKITKS